MRMTACRPRTTPEAHARRSSFVATGRGNVTSERTFRCCRLADIGYIRLTDYAGGSCSLCCIFMV